jgi:hypothetical protein
MFISKVRDGSHLWSQKLNMQYSEAPVLARYFSPKIYITTKAGVDEGF